MMGKGLHCRIGVQAGNPPGNREIKSKGLSWHTAVSTAVLPFIFEHAEKFAEELGSFLESGLDIAAYDSRCELVTSTADNADVGKNISTGLPTKDVSLKGIELYDADIDDNGTNAIVRSPGVEAQSQISDESLPDLRLHNLNEKKQDRKHSYREVANKVSKMTVESCFPGEEDSLKGGSKRKRQVSNKRKPPSRGVSARSSSMDKQKERRKSKSIGDRYTYKSRKSRRQVDSGDEGPDQDKGKYKKGVSKKKTTNSRGKRATSQRGQGRGAGVNNKRTASGNRPKKPTQNPIVINAKPRNGKRKKSSVTTSASTSGSYTSSSFTDSSTCSSDGDSSYSSSSESDGRDLRRSNKRKVTKIGKSDLNDSNGTGGYIQKLKPEQTGPDHSTSRGKDGDIVDNERLPNFSKRLPSENSPTLRHLTVLASHRAETGQTNDNDMSGQSVQVPDHTGKGVGASSNPSHPGESVIGSLEWSQESVAVNDSNGSFPASEKRVDVNKDLSLEARLREQALINFHIHLSQKKTKA